MDTIKLHNPITVFGREVTTFPNGVGEAFDDLVNKVEGGLNRPYFGICYQNAGNFRYIAAAQQQFPGEGLKYHCEEYTVDAGEYATVVLREWRKNIPKIKDIFCNMFTDDTVDKHSPSIEWYKSDDELICMVRLKSR